MYIIKQWEQTHFKGHLLFLTEAFIQDVQFLMTHPV